MVAWNRETHSWGPNNDTGHLDPPRNSQCLDVSPLALALVVTVVVSLSLLVSFSWGLVEEVSSGRSDLLHVQ